MNKQVNWLISIFFAALLLFSVDKANGSDIMGADMTYRCLGNDSFEFTTVVYKDCNANWSIPANIYNLNISGVNCTYTPRTVSPQLISCIDITPVCAGFCTKCVSTCNAGTSNTGCTFPYGIEKLTFRVVVYLGGTSCCNFHIGYIGNSTRNYATTTCCNSDIFYTYVELNRCITPCNSSPIFTNDPVGIICANQDFVFNNGALDTLDSDDSLSFELAPAMKGQNQQATYFGNFSFVRPLTFFGFPNQNLSWPAGFHVDPLTGDLLFRPTQANQIAVIVMKVTEWRRINGTMTKISETRRDMQFIVIACPNNAVPTIAPPYSMNACANQQICVDITTSDANVNDSVRISWNRGIRGATFTNSNGQKKFADGRVCWTPTNNDISNIPHTFTITAKDNACPVTGQSVRSFSIFVRETPEVTLSTQLLPCGKVALSYTPFKTYPGFASNWTIRDELNRAVYESGNNVQYDTVQLQPGKYRATLNFRTGTPCFNLKSDTFTIVDFVRVRLPNDTAVCIGNSLLVNANTWGGSTPYSHSWYRLTDTTPVGPLSSATAYNISPNGTVRYAIRVQDASGCRNADTITVRTSPPPVMNLGPDVKACPGSFTLIDAGTTGSNYSFLWNTGDTTRNIWADQTNRYSLTIRDSLGCTNSDSVMHEYVNMPISAGPDRTVCTNDTIAIMASGADLYQWYNELGFSLNPLPSPIGTGDSLGVIVNQSKGFILRGRKTFDSTLQCIAYDTVQIYAQPAPFNQLTPLGPYCPTQSPIALVSAIQPPTSFDGIWSSPTTPQAIIDGMFHPTLAGPGNHTISYEVVDVYGCRTRRNITITVRQAPAIKLKDTARACSNEPELLLNSLREIPANYNGFRVDWYEANGNGAVISGLDKTDPLNAKLRLLNTVPVGDYFLVLRIESIATGCWSTDTTLLRVLPTPIAEAGFIAAKCWNEPAFNLNAASGASPIGGTWTSAASFSGPDMFTPSSVGIDKQFLGDQVWFFYTVSLNTCSSRDSVLLDVKPIPLLAFQSDTFCISQGSIDLTSLVNPFGASSSFSGNGVSGNEMDLVQAGKGLHYLRYEFQGANGCRNNVQNQILIVPLPTISAVIPDNICEGNILALSSSYTEASGVTWFSSGTGVFTGGSSTSNQDQTGYQPSAFDLANGNTVITVRTRQESVCAEAEFLKLVRVFPLPKPIINALPLSGCEPLQVLFSVSGNVPSGSNYTWNFGEGAPVNGMDLNAGIQHTYNQYGQYTTNLSVTSGTDQGSCMGTAAPVGIEVYPRPEADMDADKWLTSVNFPGIQFYDRSTVAGNANINYWEWQFGDPNGGMSNQANPYYEFPVQNPIDTANYWVQLLVRTNNDCYDTASRLIQIIPELSVFIPNAFTPNREGSLQNEKFVVVAGNYKHITIRIFNRWGELLFTSNSADNSWDGTYKGEPAQQDVYMYVVEVTNMHGKVYNYSGTVTLLR